MSAPASAQSASTVHALAFAFGAPKDVAAHAGAVGRPTGIEREPPHALGEPAAPDPALPTVPPAPAPTEPALPPLPLPPLVLELPAFPTPPPALPPAVPTSLFASPPQCVTPTSATLAAMTRKETGVDGRCVLGMRLS
jgi:hypothetical protein